MPSFQVNTKWAAMSEVVPGLYVSGVSALKPEELMEKGIKCIINATNEVPNLQIPKVDKMKLWISDTKTEDISCFFHMVSDHIQTCLRQKIKVLLHCVAGVSRSVALCMAYLVKYQKCSLRQAFHLLSAKREMVRPNLGFWRQLIEFEKQIKDGQSTVRFLDTTSPEDGSALCVPDVYFPMVVRNRKNSGGEAQATAQKNPEGTSDKENSPPGGGQQQTFFAEGRERRYSGEKFVPKLEPLPEIEREP